MRRGEIRDVRYRRSCGLRPLAMLERQRAAVNAAAAITLVVVGSSACGVMSGGVRGGPQASAAVVATIPLSNYGTDVAVRPDGKRAYVPLQVGSVLALDLTSRQVASTITTDGRPYGIALTRDGTRGYVTDLSAMSLFVLDTQNDSLAQSISLQSIARPIKTPAVALSPDGRSAYVTNATVMDDHLLVIDTAANSIASDHPLNIHPVGVAASPDGRLLYVVGCKFACVDGTLLVIDVASANVLSRIPLPAAPTGFALSPDGSRAYVPTGLAATVLAVNLTTGAVTTIPVDAEPIGIAVDPTGAFVYVTCYGAASVNVIDARTSAVVARVTVANEPRAIAVSPDGRLAYVTHSSPICSVIDLQRITRVPGT
jgi:YVTN family beta-propeller protein